MDMSRSNVVLTGFMATGKSTVGRMLADALGYEWVDTDAAIEAEHGPIVKIFMANGEEAFRQMERDLATELASRQGVVISTGGGMMLDPAAATRLGASGRVFCLTAAPGEILARVEAQDGPSRPLLGGGAPGDRIEDLLSQRVEAYSQFEQVTTDARTFDEIVADLITRLSAGSA